VTRDQSDHVLTEELINVVDLDIEQVSLRLRVWRLAEAIEPLESIPSARESALVVRSLVANNLRYKLASTEPLDRAIDFLSLGRDFVGKGNFPLAVVSLQKAETALDVPLSEMTAAYASEVQAVKAQIARTSAELSGSAF